MNVDSLDFHAERIEFAGVEYVKAPPEVLRLGVALAAAEVALLVGTLFVVFAGRVVPVAAAVAGLVAVGGLRVQTRRGRGGAGRQSARVPGRDSLVRLSKRAVKRDCAEGRVQVMCSWNLSALSLGIVDRRRPLAVGLAEYLDAASEAIAEELTGDPAGVSGKIQLPSGVTQRMAADRLSEMAEIVWGAIEARSEFAARNALSPLFGVEIDEIRARELNRVASHPLNGALRSRSPSAVAAAIDASVPLKPIASDGR